MSLRSSARGQQRTITMFDIVPPGLHIKSTSLIFAHKGRWQPVHHLSPFAFQWKALSYVNMSFAWCAFSILLSGLKIGRDQLLTPLCFLSQKRRAYANFYLIFYKRPQLLKMTGLLCWHLHSCVTVLQTFCDWMLGDIFLSALMMCMIVLNEFEKLFGVSQGCSLFLMKVITKTQGKYCQIKLCQCKLYL